LKASVLALLVIFSSIIMTIAFFTPTASAALAWVTETADSEINYWGGRGSSLAINSQGYPSISFFDDRYDRLDYAYKDQSGWNIEPVGYDPLTYSGSIRAIRPSLVMNNQDFPCISCYDEWGDTIKYAYKDSSGWHIEQVAGVQDQDGQTSLALDSTGTPHISYYDANCHLSIAHRQPSGTWVLEVVDGSAYVGQFNSLAIDSNNDLHVAYYDATNHLLKYMGTKDGVWESRIVDTVGTVGIYRSLGCSLSLNHADYPSISYYDSSTGYVKLAYSVVNLLGWNFATENVANYKAEYGTSLALNSVGTPCIAFADSITYRLKYSYTDISGWHTETVSTADVHFNDCPSLAIDNYDNPCISYFDYPNISDEYPQNYLKYANIQSLIVTPESPFGATPVLFAGLVAVGSFVIVKNIRSKK
jgi:hypothetical protein